MTRRRQPATIRLAACLAVALCATGAIAAATSQPAAASSLIDNLPRALGRTHPMLVHFPIALLIAGVLFEFIAIVVRRDRTKPSVAGLACVTIGAARRRARRRVGRLAQRRPRDPRPGCRRPHGNPPLARHRRRVARGRRGSSAASSA
ncbi:MAG: hypothetical protein HND58_17785 [Planctomycetota bacterium]|nr:MAG: hypothetical protein HND58_17785 [Planctomycetota bacterium]